jgi:hypothetical protein
MMKTDSANFESVLIALRVGFAGAPPPVESRKTSSLDDRNE